MLTIKTKLGLSPIAGIGLFAAEDIKKGTVTWRFVPEFDRLFRGDEIHALPEPARSNLLDHVYLDDASGLYVLCADNARFMNHADDPNTAGVHEAGAVEGYDVATRDIAAGEELTCDYQSFDADANRKLGTER
ncbi:SET domain-containing protein-lysine N-methyltransferase [Hyphomicrobium methylovorum]|uniref:SET domain-containing protein n=1 Tax=Hyphomicrobium methylovorum TaxID=84 RepID=UPI0015E7AC9D|nr:SET domain-containing protein [Hyphomicrobium methylovorum]MBA2125389.1 SET domain-containing protein-lysine N-methyltransferase [Hyphomicrobium methylovorum]